MNETALKIKQDDLDEALTLDTSLCYFYSNQMGAEDCRNVDAPRGFNHLVNVPGISEINYISDPTASRLCYADITAIPHCDSHRNPPDSNDNSLICKTI